MVLDMKENRSSAISLCELLTVCFAIRLFFLDQKTKQNTTTTPKRQKKKKVKKKQITLALLLILCISFSCKFSYLQLPLMQNTQDVCQSLFFTWIHPSIIYCTKYHTAISVKYPCWIDFISPLCCCICQRSEQACWSLPAPSHLLGSCLFGGCSRHLGDHMPWEPHWCGCSLWWSLCALTWIQASAKFRHCGTKVIQAAKGVHLFLICAKDRPCVSTEAFLLLLLKQHPFLSLIHLLVLGCSISLPYSEKQELFTNIACRQQNWGTEFLL